MGADRTGLRSASRRTQVTCSAAAATLLVVAIWLPFWRVDLRAPQYPSGLHMVAYGNRIAGDLREINIINHYVGMEHIDTAPAPEMSLFVWAIAALVLLALAAPLHRFLARLAIIVVGVTPFVILADLQWWLHKFGRNLNPKAPIRVEPFTPLALGTSKIGNFESTAMVSWGFFVMLAAAGLLWLGHRNRRRAPAARLAAERASVDRSTSGRRSVPADPSVGRDRSVSAGPSVARDRSASAGRSAMGVTGAVVLAIAALASPSAGGNAAAIASAPARLVAGGGEEGTAAGAAPLSAGPGAADSLQAVVDAAAPGSTIRVVGGVHVGPLRIHGPLTVVGVGGPVIEGDGRGSVVEIDGDRVAFRGFTVRNSGRAVTEEAAGIKIRGSGHRVEDNVVVDVYFGIHLSDGADNVVIGNRIAPGEKHGARPGHALSLWHQRGTRVVGNVISDSRDGIYLSFADDLHAEGNEVSGARYGIHSMYSEHSTFAGNRLHGNLLGAALMYSNGLRMRCNHIADNRRGATAYGVLLKDIDDLLLEDNLIVANRVGIYADNTPLGIGRQALVRRNRIVGNDTALALQSNVALTFYDNELAGNLTIVRSEGKGLSAANRWSHEGRGNYWDVYTGYDVDGDGIGDVPFRYEQAMNEVLARSPLARAFVYTPASLALEHAARIFPLVRVEPLIVDPTPLTRPGPPACGEPSR